MMFRFYPQLSDVIRGKNSFEGLIGFLIFSESAKAKSA
jgi:hypothetical protein